MEINKIYAENMVVGYILDEHEIYSGDVDNAVKVGECTKDGKVYDTANTLIYEFNNESSYSTPIYTGKDKIYWGFAVDNEVKSTSGKTVCYSDKISKILAAAVVLLFNLNPDGSATLKRKDSSDALKNTEAANNNPNGSATVKVNNTQIKKPNETKNTQSAASETLNKWSKWYKYFEHIPKIIACISLIFTIVLTIIVVNIYGNTSIAGLLVFASLAGGIIVSFVIYAFSSIVVSATILKVEYLKNISENSSEIKKEINRK